MAITVAPIQESDIPGAIDCIQQAFAEDPYNHWVFNDRQKFSLARNRVSLGIRCRWGMRNAMFHVAKEAGDDTVLGVAMWMPPQKAGAPETWGDWAESWRLWVSQVGMNLWYGRGGLNVKRYYIWKAAQAEVQKEVWTDPEGYYFLNIITVLPSAQGKGIGRALFNEVTQKADREGRRCYLESSRDEPNVKIYQAIGFDLVKEMDCRDGEAADGTIKLFCMIREPQGER